jgi:hypothetical protein
MSEIWYNVSVRVNLSNVGQLTLLAAPNSPVIALLMDRVIVQLISLILLSSVGSMEAKMSKRMLKHGIQSILFAVQLVTIAWIIETSKAGEVVHLHAIPQS